jgi:pilus assembly protein CpaC
VPATQPAGKPALPGEPRPVIGGAEPKPVPGPGGPTTTDPFGPDKPRLQHLGAPVLGKTPAATPERMERQREFVETIIDPEHTLDLVVGRPRLVVLKEKPNQYQIADESVASVNFLSVKEMTIMGQKVGTTVLNLWFPDPKDPTKQKILSYLVRAIPDPEIKERLERVYKALEDEINHAFPDSVIHLALVGDKLMVCGQAKDIAEATQILRICRANAPGQAPSIPVSQLNVNFTPDAASPDPQATPGLSSFLLAGGPNVINLIRIPGEQTVMLRVTVAEVNRAAARSIGVNFTIVNNQGIAVFSQLTGGIGGPNLTPGVAGNNLPFRLDNGQITAAMNALRSLNYARTLAEPLLTTMNGQTASFQAGGQFPVPVVTGFTNAGLQGTAFVPFGVQLHFTPYVTDKDRIRLQVSADVSTRDNDNSALINGTNVPSLNTRNFQTTVELREGQTLAVAGLIQNNIGAKSDRVPFFGDLPVVGRLAGFDQLNAGEQELVVLITPELVHPMEPKEVPPLPGSDLFEPGDLEFYLLGRLESRRSYDYDSPVRTDIHRMGRYRHAEDIYIFGPHGHTPLP